MSGWLIGELYSDFIDVQLTDSAFSNSPPDDMTAPSSFNTKCPNWFSMKLSFDLWWYKLDRKDISGDIAKERILLIS